ncbi:uncharacterized protein LOC114656169 [Erpetoichthys calabaricus]|uniref:uncharacterized protein LOC114656169 n=1 Tax=Erpetoichthys calabaricus TaxID=27687 RepID=UPI00223486FE|nr:uncharacterized protein LOC114656169 [Erpetoichthys calabaricus]
MARHRSILKTTEEPTVVFGAQEYACLFCYKRTDYADIISHLQSHKRTVVVHGGFKIYKCSLNCQGSGHYHCCYCQKTVVRKDQFLRHLSECGKGPKALSVPTAPVASQPMPTAPVDAQPLPSVPTAPVTAQPLPSVPMAPVAAQPLPTAWVTTQSLPSMPTALVATQSLPSVPTALVATQSLPSLPTALVTTQSLPSMPTAPVAAQPLPSEFHKVVQAKIRKVKCSLCNLRLNKKNLRVHMKRKHSSCKQGISTEHHLKSMCIDKARGIFAVAKAFHGESIPVHVQKKTWGSTYKILCEMDVCRRNSDFALRNGLMAFDCQHSQSLSYCLPTGKTDVVLTEEVLNDMVREKWIGEHKKEQCLKRQREATEHGITLSNEVTLNDKSSKQFISVYEPKVSYYSRLARVSAYYDIKCKSWHCPCSKPRMSCLHKYIAKWHLFQTNRECFKRVKSTED